MKFYILTSSDLEGVWRNTQVIPHEETVVVINSQSDNYRAVAENFCIRNSLEYYITESDGTPATGKNSVIKLFLESNNDYMVQIDGDDQITPRGVNLYKAMSQSKDCPDMVALYRQPRFRKILDFDAFIHIINDLRGGCNEDWGLEYPYDKSWMLSPSADWLTSFMKREHNVGIEKATEWANARTAFNKAMQLYSDVNEYMLRMVFYSRNIAEEVCFDNNLLVGEDTIQFLKLKKLAFEGKYNILRRKERHYPSYVQLKNYNSITVSQSKQTMWDWIPPFMDTLNTIKHELPEGYSLPELHDGTYI